MNRPILKLPQKTLSKPTLRLVENPKSFRKIRKGLEMRWPALFNKKDPMPLKIGIFNDLVERTGYDPKRLSRFLGNWTHRKPYLRSLKMGNRRMDLDGNLS